MKNSNSVKSSLFILSVAFLLGCSTSQKVQTTEQEKTTTKTSEFIPTDPNVKKGVLENGLTYYIQRNSKPEQKVELRLVVNAGSILEDEKQLGLAHFVEHMNFNGSKNFKKNELVDYLQSIGVKFGAHLNAYTSFDETVYILPIPTDVPEKLEKGFLILEDWAFNASFSAEEIEKERGVVLEEFRLGLGAQKKMLAKYLPKLMYNSHYANRLPIGKKEILENFSHEDLIRFYKDWYRPDLMAVVAVGDVDVAVLEEKIKAHFGKYSNPQQSKERVEFSVPNHKETFVEIVKDKEATNTAVQIYYKDPNPVVPVVTVADFKESLVQNLFRTLINVRLNELATKENPPYIYGYASYGSTWAKLKNAYRAVAMCGEQGQLRALEALLIENKRALKYGFSQSELERAKKSILTRFERSFREKEKTLSRNYAGQYVQNYLKEAIIPGAEWKYEQAKKTLPIITLQECNALLKSYISDENRVVIFSGPDKKDISEVTKSQVFDLLAKVESQNVAPYVEVNLERDLMDGLNLIPGKIIEEKRDTIFELTTLLLSNGATVTYKKTDFKDNEILFSAQSQGGMSLYSDQELHATQLANGGLAEAGVNGFNRIDLQKKLMGKSVLVSPQISELQESLSGFSAPKDFETLFQLTHLYFTRLNYNESTYNSYISKYKAYFKNALSNPTTYFGAEINKFLEKGNPRFVGFPLPEDWEKADYALAYKKYNERFSDAGDFNFYFVGNFEEDKLKNFAVTYLASLPSHNSKEIFSSHEYRPFYGNADKTIYRGAEPKSVVQILFRGETQYSSEEAYYLKSLGQLLTIKLIERLRENESGVYGVRARGNMERNPYGNYSLSIGFPCGPENVEKLVQSALNELELLIEKGPELKDLDKVKETQLLELKENTKRNQYWMNQMRNAGFNNIAMKTYADKEAAIQKLTQEKLQEVAKKYGVKNRFIAILKPEK